MQRLAPRSPVHTLNANTLPSSPAHTLDTYAMPDGYREGKFTAAVDSIPTALRASERKKPEGKERGGECKQTRTEGKILAETSLWFLCCSPFPLLS